MFAQDGALCVSQCWETPAAVSASKVQTNNKIKQIYEAPFRRFLFSSRHMCVSPRETHTHTHRVCRWVCACGCVDQAEARPAILYQRKYSRPYHTRLGCPHWPFYLSHMSWIPDLITALLSQPPLLFYCNIVTHSRVFAGTSSQSGTAGSNKRTPLKSFLSITPCAFIKVGRERTLTCLIGEWN